MAIKPVTRSGWCMKLPVTEYNQAEHDGCFLYFMSSTCTCECGHKGERSLASRETVYQPYLPPKKQQLVIKQEEDNDEDD